MVTAACIGQHRPQPLAAGKDRVAHGAVNRGGHGFALGKQLFQRPVGQLRAFLRIAISHRRGIALMINEAG